MKKQFLSNKWNIHYLRQMHKTSNPYNFEKTNSFHKKQETTHSLEPEMVESPRASLNNSKLPSMYMRNRGLSYLVAPLNVSTNP